MNKDVLLTLVIFGGLFLGLTGGPARALELVSPSFKNGEYIPVKHACPGRDVSPALKYMR